MKNILLSENLKAIDSKQFLILFDTSLRQLRMRVKWLKNLTKNNASKEIIKKRLDDFDTLFLAFIEFYLALSDSM